MTDAWGNTLRFCLRAIVATACAVVVNLMLASDPSADDAVRGVGSYGTGAAGGALTMKFLEMLFNSKDE